MRDRRVRCHWRRLMDMDMLPMGRAGTDEEMAQGVIFLTKNKYVNGEVIAIDGGVLLEMPGR